MFYLVRTPYWLKKLYGKRLWELPGPGKKIYLTFDDGPHPEITSFVLDELDKFDAKASFFCIGRNVEAHPGVYAEILKRGHTTGNHTYDHCNGWKTETGAYVDSIQKAKTLIDSNLFRPPYGRMSAAQAKKIASAENGFQTVMWTVLSGDFDPAVTPEQCRNNVIRNTGNGSIVVFHDSEKAYRLLKETLPAVLAYFSEKGFSFEKLPVKKIKKS